MAAAINSTPNPVVNPLLSAYRAGASIAGAKSNGPDVGANRNGGKEQTPAVQITLSPEAVQAARRIAPPASVSPPPDPVLQLRQAEGQLRQVLAELGIPASTSVKIRAAAVDGDFAVESEDVKAAELEARLNDGTALELRNALARAQQASQRNAQLDQEGFAQRLARATGAPNAGLDNNYYPWAHSPGRTLAALDFLFTFDQSKLSGQSLAPNGQALGINVLS